MPAKLTQMTGRRTRGFAAVTAPSSVNVEAGTFSVVASTETPVRTLISDPKDRKRERTIEVDEVLKADAFDLSRVRGMPLVDGHQTDGGIGAVLGLITDARIDDGKLVADVELNSRNRDLIHDIARGHYAQVSIGYDIDPADYQIEQRAGGVPLATSQRTLLTEISLVPVGADPNASIRGLREAPASTQETTMDELEKVIADAEQALAAVEAALDTAGDGASEELRKRARKLREEKKDEEETEEQRKKREAEEEKKDEEEVRSLRSIATTYGLGKLVDNMRGLKAKPDMIRAAINTTLATRGAAAADGAVPATEKKVRTVSSTQAIYDRMNGKK